MLITVKLTIALVLKYFLPQPGTPNHKSVTPML